MATELSSGPARVVAQGMASTFFGHPLQLVLPLAEDAPFTVVFAFVDEGGEAPSVRPELDGDRLTLTCVDFDDAYGRGSAQPVLLGEHGGWLWFLHFRAFRFGATVDRTVHYTIYRGRPEDLGATLRPLTDDAFSGPHEET